MPPSTPPLLAIFDHDGVLVDSLELHQQAWLEMGRREGLAIITPEFIRETFGMTNPSIFERLFGGRVDAATLRRYSDLKEACYRDLAGRTICLMDGVRELLDRLSAAGVWLAIGSSGVRANLELTVDACGLAGRFAAIASLEDIHRGKPDPEVFLVAARQAGVDPRHAAVFEDAPVGIQAAKAAGMHAVGVTTTHPATPLYEAGADDVVASLRDYPVERLVRRLRLGILEGSDRAPRSATGT